MVWLDSAQEERDLGVLVPAAEHEPGCAQVAKRASGILAWIRNELIIPDLQIRPMPFSGFAVRVKYCGKPHSFYLPGNGYSKMERIYTSGGGRYVPPLEFGGPNAERRPGLTTMPLPTIIRIIEQFRLQNASKTIESNS
ncbi:hypothetical protein DUI87_18891 [Hirundo rustica rustica]|uniref:Uncharacterized protein n=1 Tax=Hirundo rustica rustica TaxID=333673 RepID=A0A3M0JU36_HIRRU|nr:hypothetical protein DUI87_18891 [Hirundo rustica rustica]